MDLSLHSSSSLRHGPPSLPRPACFLLQVTSPFYLWQLWRADARHARQCLSKHNSMMDEKVAALLKLPPPDYTIAG